MAHTFSGKSTIGSELARDLSIPFIDGDALHPAANVAKMSSGSPLTDEDRLPWLQIIRATGEKECRSQWEQGRGRSSEKAEGKLGRPAVIIACSALRKYYRDILRGDIEVQNPSEVSILSGHPLACMSIPQPSPH